MLNKFVIGSFLASAVLAVPFPHSIHDVASRFVRSPPSTTVFPQMGRRATNEAVTGSLSRLNNTNLADGIGGGADQYTLYTGSGTTDEGWPSQNSWVSFEDMFNNNKVAMRASCENLGSGPNNSDEEIGDIFDGIQQAAQATGVDHRFILAVIMQESGGCVRVQGTNLGVNNPGLMQDHNGAASCNNKGATQNPCPSSTISQMISEGTAGTNDGDGLANCINQAGSSDVSAFYRAARIYNSGSISKTGQLQNGIATHCYASDIANRLTGWVNSPHKCDCDSNPDSCGVVTN